MLPCPPVKTRRLTLAAAFAAPLLAALLAPARVPVTRADVPPILLPPHRDTTVSIESEPAPLLQPGRPGPADAERVSREKFAREQYELGRALEAQRVPAAAIAAYRNAVRNDPKLLDAHYRMGLLYTAVGQHRAAVSEYAAEVTLDPGNRVAARALGLALASDGDTANAVRQLELLTRRGAKDAASWKALGFAYGLARRPADSERALRHALSLDARDAGTWRDLGLVLSLLGRAPEAREAYRRSARLAPRDGSASLNAGNLEAREGRWPAALADYREAVSRDSTLAPAYAGQIKALVALGRSGEVGAIYRRWLAVRPDSPEARIEAIRYFSARDRDDIALELARDGVRANPASGEAHVALGMALDATGDAAGMLTELRRAEKLLRQPEQRDRLRATIASLRAQAPDSLRAVYTADSLAHEVPGAARRDATPGTAPPGGAAADSVSRR